MNIIELVFWISLSAIAIFYTGYFTLSVYLSRTKKLNVKKNQKFRPKISIVIPTWNERNSIKKKLENTLKLRYPRNKLEFLVIDSKSTDGTPDIIKKFKSFKLIIEKERRGKAHALNRIFKHCSGDIILITDADCLLNEDALVKSIPYFADPSVGAITGREEFLNVSENLATKSEKAYRKFFYIFRHAESVLDSTYIFDGPFMAFRKELLQNISVETVAEDSEIAFIIRKKGFRTISIPDVKYYDYAPTNLSERAEQKSRRAQGLLQSLFHFFPDFFLNPEYGLFGFLIFPSGFFMHVISPFLLLIVGITLFLMPQYVLIPFLLLLSLSLLIPRTRSFVLTFLHSNFSILKGIVTLFIKGPEYRWKKIQSTRRC
jgi:cellulose synthase/poly-beta-1,6-N-acetylglucosamine synthase-like glycosyltransferase